MKKAATFISILIAILGVIVPIMWSYYTTISSLEVRLDSQTSLLQDDPLLNDVIITYKDQPIRGLTRVDFTLINTGKTPITADDIVDALVIHFQPDVEVIAATVVREDPDNLSVEITATSNRPEVLLKIELLNPTDFVQFAVYLNKLPSSVPVVTARIKGIKAVSVVNNIPEKVNVKPQVSWVTYPISCVSVGFLMLLPFAAKETFMQVRTRRFLRKNPSVLTSLVTPESFEEFISDNLSFALNTDKKVLAEYISDYKNDTSQHNKSRISAKIKEIVNKTGGAESVLYVAVVSIVATMIFILWQIY